MIGIEYIFLLTAFVSNDGNNEKLLDSVDQNLDQSWIIKKQERIIMNNV